MGHDGQYGGVTALPAFPASLRAFQQQFSSEEACFRYLVEARWPDGSARKTR